MSPASPNCHVSPGSKVPRQMILVFEEFLSLMDTTISDASLFLIVIVLINLLVLEAGAAIKTVSTVPLITPSVEDSVNAMLKSHPYSSYHIIDIGRSAATKSRNAAVSNFSTKTACSCMTARSRKPTETREARTTICKSKY